MVFMFNFIIIIIIIKFFMKQQVEHYSTNMKSFKL